MDILANPRVLLVTANVGSIFEDPDVMLKQWTDEFVKTVREKQPALLALHCQEVGGKNYEESMQHVNLFVKRLLADVDLQSYDRARIYLDEDFTAVDKFTALGNIYFIHNSLHDVQMWNFADNKYEAIEHRDICAGNIDSVPTKEKAKFPKHFFPDFAWSRKGYLRTRWRIQGVTFELVNIHLFHDASNLVAMRSSPSVYSNNRKNALLHTLDILDSSQHKYFLFGDFNFRLDSHDLIRHLTSDLVRKESAGKNGDIKRVEWRESSNDRLILAMEKKFFDLEEQENIFLNKRWILEYDKERHSIGERLGELVINFPPSYPFSEDATDGTHYMRTRAPAWCDRILYSPNCSEIMNIETENKDAYNVIGRDVCMGDHKPIFLEFRLKGCRQADESVSGKTSDLASAEHVVLDVGKNVVPSAVACSTRFSQPRLSVNGEDVRILADLDIHANALFEVQDALPDAILSKLKSEGKPSFRRTARSIQRTSSVIKKWQHIRHHSSSSEDEPLPEVVSRSASKRRSIESRQAQERAQVEQFVNEVIHSAVQKLELQESRKAYKARVRSVCPCGIL